MNDVANNRKTFRQASCHEWQSENDDCSVKGSAFPLQQCEEALARPAASLMKGRTHMSSSRCFGNQTKSDESRMILKGAAKCSMSAVVFLQIDCTDQWKIKLAWSKGLYQSLADFTICFKEKSLS